MRLSLVLVTIFLCHALHAADAKPGSSAKESGSAPSSQFQDEQTPLNLSGTASGHLAEPHFQAGQLILVLMLLMIAGGCTVFFFRFLKNKGKWQGSRKYLIEQLGYCSMGNKMGVSLLKIGREFILVGITPQQVTMLSKLPKLEAQYEEETQFERETFRDAVGEEVRRQENGLEI